MTVGRWLFLRAIGLIYATAFLSFRSQADGLIGAHGISPLPQFLHAVRFQYGNDASWYFPTICWFDSSDQFLHRLCDAGVLAGLLATAGFVQALALSACWIVYLSLQVAGQQFMGFQWDILLLEAGFIAIWWAPMAWRPRPLASGWADRIGRWMALWLLFRLMVASGMVKLLSGDGTWRTLTALSVHYETQPLPTPLAWWAHQLPATVQKACCGALFFIELVVPWVVFIPIAAVRRAGAGAIILLMLVIALTGNYCFFNLLAVTLCLPLIDDGAWPSSLRRFAGWGGPRPGRNWPIAVVAPFAMILGLASTVLFTSQMRLGLPWPAPAVSLFRTVSNFRVVNGYGLFANMTTERNEITVEGSREGKVWTPYRFRWKPGLPGRAPGFVAPHQPRLDWQMWFAALTTAKDNPWFVSLCIRLLEGEPTVLALLADNPFSAAPPRFIRARTAGYHLARPDSGPDWWTVEPPGEYLAPISLTNAVRRP